MEIRPEYASKVLAAVIVLIAYFALRRKLPNLAFGGIAIISLGIGNLVFGMRSWFEAAAILIGAVVTILAIRRHKSSN